MSEPPKPEPTEDEWREYRRQHQMMIDNGRVSGYCPYSGLRITGCKISDICDCFDYPDLEPT